MAKTVKFEKSLARLEEIVEQLEDPETALDDSMKMFEEGIKIVASCSDYLRRAELKMQELVEESGKLTQKDLDHGE